MSENSTATSEQYKYGRLWPDGTFDGQGWTTERYARRDHDHAKENWSRGNNKQPGCSCPGWRYNPRYERPTDPDCEQHGSHHDGA